MTNVSIKEKIAIPASIETRSNIKKSYENLDEESRSKVDIFLTALESKDSYLQRTVLQSINKNYSESLLGIAELHKLLSDMSTEQEMDFLVCLSNKLIATESVSKYLTDNNVAESFDFFEYNSFINRGLSDDAINKLASMRKKGDVSKILLSNNDETFEMKLHNIF